MSLLGSFHLHGVSTAFLNITSTFMRFTLFYPPPRLGKAFLPPPPPTQTISSGSFTPFHPFLAIKHGTSTSKLCTKTNFVPASVAPSGNSSSKGPWESRALVTKGAAFLEVLLQMGTVQLREDEPVQRVLIGDSFDWKCSLNTEMANA